MNIQNEKILNSLLYFANKSNNKWIDRLKLMKMIWLSDRIHLSKFGRMIIKDTYCAMPKGPIPSIAMNFSKENQNEKFIVRGMNIGAIKDFDDTFFSKSDIEIMNYVWNKFGSEDSNELSEFSHLFPEWKRFENALNEKNTPNSYPIQIDDFFEYPDISIFNDIISEEEIVESKSMFQSNNEIQSFLNS